jgi:hypothetical protein
LNDENRARKDGSQYNGNDQEGDKGHRAAPVPVTSLRELRAVV